MKRILPPRQQYLHAVDLQTNQDAESGAEDRFSGSSMGECNPEKLRGMGSSTVETGGGAKLSSLTLFGDETERLAHIP